MGNSMNVMKDGKSVNEIGDQPTPGYGMARENG
jgi:hypothetical protein